MKKFSIFLMLLMAFGVPLAMNAQNEMRRESGIVRSQLEPREIQIGTPLNNEPSRLTLTVNQGNQTSAYIPIPRSYVNTGDTETQFILSASSLSGLVPDGYYANITGLSFACNNQTGNFGTYYVLIQEGSFDGSGFFYSVNDMTIAYYGTLSASNRAMSFTFNQLADGFDYFGGDLMICFYQTAAGTNSTRLNWSGVTATGMAAYWNGSSGALANFLPQTTFTYTRVEASCVKPADLDLFAIDKTAAGLYWTERGQSTEWEVSYSTTSGDPDNGTIVPVTEGEPYCILTGLTEGTIYYAYVRSICDGNTTSDWSDGIGFRTPGTCDQPSDVAVSNVSQTSADVSWYGYDESYDVRYRKQSAGHDIANFINNQVGRNTTTSASFTDYTFSLSSYSGNGYLAIRHYNISDMFWLDVATVTVKDANGNTVFTGDLTNGIPDGWFTVDYDDDGYNWNATTGFVYSESYSNDVGPLNPDNWLITPQVPLGGSVVINAKGQDSSYAAEVFGVYVSTTAIVEYPWTTDEDVEGESHPFAGLDPETTYEVQVKAHSCPGDWSNTVTFTTLSGCDAPVGLTTTNIIGPTATLNWAEALDQYNVQYRKGFVYDFESATPWAVDDFAPCTTYDGDGSETGGIQNVTFTNQGYTGSFIAFQNGTAATNAVAHGGNAFGACFYASPAPNNDWFILPELSIEDGDIFSFWAKSFSSSYLESFIVGIYSGNGNFETVIESNSSVSDTWTEYSYNLSEYAGQTIQLAINCNSDDKFALFIDDIFVGNPNNGWSDPITVAGATYTLTGLDMNSNYIWQVQGVNCDGNGGTSEWSASASFATGEFYTKTIEPYTSDNDGYYLIASPLANNVAPTDVVGMITDNLGANVDVTTSTYDLYSFDQAAVLEWQNYRANTFELVNGQGYLYASKEGTELVFTGAGNSNNTQDVTLSMATAADGLDFPDWNLVGNPFAKDNAYLSDGRAFYSMQNSGVYTPQSGAVAIGPMEGVFVVANSDEETLTFTTTQPNKHVAQLTLNLTKSGVSTGSTLLDRAIVNFGEGGQLPKLQFRKGSTQVYIPMEGKDYAVVRSEAMGTMPVCFKAENNGSYTLSFTTEEVSFGYLHLIDNMNGNDVDLLQTPSYTFEAKTTDYESRFKLVFATGNNDDNFAFFSNGSFVINNEGNATLQVIDINGRILKSESINGCANVNVKASAGVYMLRLVNGNDVKVQKVVVR